MDYCGYKVFYKEGRLQFLDDDGNCHQLTFSGFGNTNAVGFGGAGGRGPRGFQGAQGAQGSNECLILVTYAELLALILSNTLEPGCFYLITDFQTTHIIPNTATLHVGTIEPIIVQALTTNSIHQEASSTIFPADELFYEVVDSTTSGGTKGRIYYRYDTIKDNTTWYDWRSVIFRRWESAPASGVFNVLTDNGGGFNDYYTYNEIYIGQPFGTAPFCFSNELKEITDFGIGAFGAPSSKLNNFVFIGATYRNIFAVDCYDNTIGISIGVGNVIIDNVVQILFVNNTIGNNFTNNNIKAQFNTNIIENNFGGNIIGVSFNTNIIGDDFINNRIEDNFQNNSPIGNMFRDNVIGNSFENNEIGDSFTNNTVGDNFSGNFILDSFIQNQIGNIFQNNGTTTPIQNEFGNNIIADGFSENTVIGLQFRHNTIEEFFRANTIANNFESNNIGGSCNGNIVGNHFAANVIGAGMVDNSIGEDFTNNVIGSIFGSGGMMGNTIGNFFFSNFINTGFQNNEVGNNFTRNDIGSGFTGNEIGDNFEDNVIENIFQDNINITSAGFKKNHIESGLIGFDFALSTHVYSDYTFEIKRTNDETTYLGYYYVTTVPPAVLIESAVPNA